MVAIPGFMIEKQVSSILPVTLFYHLLTTISRVVCTLKKSAGVTRIRAGDGVGSQSWHGSPIKVMEDRD